MMQLKHIHHPVDNNLSFGVEIQREIHLKVLFLNKKGLIRDIIFGI